MLQYRWHRYIEKLICGNFVIIYNLLNKSIISITKQIIDSPEILEQNTKYDELQKQLLENSFIVPVYYNDKNLLQRWYDNICINNNSFEWLIVLTKDCNFSCKYCFQENDKLFREDLMENWSTNIKWFKDTIKFRKPFYVKVVFFGGEPLLKYDLMLSLSKILKSICRDNNIIWEFDIVSNGYNLTYKMYKSLVEQGLKRIQITIDGPPEIHNHRRKLKNSKKDTFTTILENILQLKNIPSVSCILRINIDRHNYETFSSLLDILDDNKMRDYLTLSIINTKSFGLEKSKWYKTCFSEEEIVEKMLPCIKEAIQRGYKIYQRSLESGPCIALTKGGFVIEPDGKISKCHHLSSLPGFNISNTKICVDDAILDYVMKPQWERCIDCKYVPICLGGCRYKVFKKNNNMQSKDCKKHIFKNMIPLYIEQFIKGEYYIA